MRLSRFFLAGMAVFFLALSARAQTPVSESQPAPESAPVSYIDHSYFTELLKRYVSKKGMVDYRMFKRDKDALTALNAYTEDMLKIEGLSLEPAEERMAYWLNLYHALVLREILKAYPIQSVSQIPHFFDGPRYEMATFPHEKVSLMDLEQKVFRERFNDPRLHLVRMNGSLSGPPLSQEAYGASGFKKKIEAATMTVLGDTTKNFYDARRKTFYASPLFDWFASDFEKYSVSNRTFLGSRLPLAPDFHLEYMGYDLRLNDTRYR